MSRLPLVWLLLCGVLLAVCPAALAQTGVVSPSLPEADAPPARPRDIDQTLVNTFTTQPLTAGRGYFRLTHRFARDLGRGSAGSLVDDVFGLDNGAVLGLEFRWGLTRTLQTGVHRTTLGKTLHTFGRWDALRQSEHSPVNLSALMSVEGQDNLRHDPQPGASVLLSRIQGTRLVLYASPTYVHDAHTQARRVLDDDADTVFVGLGARARVLETVTLVLEAAPRLAGYTPDAAAWSVAVEKLTRGHVLQLNVGNTFATTPGMLARGGGDSEAYLGFNLSRKF